MEIKSRLLILLERQKEQILAEVRYEIQKHELQAESDKEIDHTFTVCQQSRRDQLLLHEQLSCREKPSREMENETMRILLGRQKEQILADVRAEIQKHEFQADSDRRSIQELNGIIGSQRRDIDHTIAGDEQLRRDQPLLHEQLSEQNRDLREAHIKSLYEMEELKRVQESRVEESSRRRLIENQDTISEPTARIQELQNEVNCMNDSRDFKDAESVRSGLSHVPSQPALLPLFRDLGGMLSRPGRMLSRSDKPPDIWDAFLQIQQSSSAPYPPGFNPWISNVSEHTSPHVMSERQTPDTALDPRCQSRPSARNSFDRNEGRSSKYMGQTNKDCRSRIFFLTNSLLQQTFACWKIRFKPEVCTCSQFHTEAMLWIKEVEMVESVDDFKSSRSIRGTRRPDF